MANIKQVRIGGSNIKIFPITTAGTASTIPTYGTKIDVEGFVSIEYTPEVNENDFYADNGIFFSSKSTTKITGTLNVAGLPDAFYEKIYKYGKSSLGEYVETLGAEPAECAVAFEIATGDDTGDGGVRLQLYKVKFSKPSLSVETKGEGETPQPLALTFTAFARKKDDRFMIKMPNPGKSGSSAAKTRYAEYLTKVVEPTLS